MIILVKFETNRKMYVEMTLTNLIVVIFLIIVSYS